MTFALVLALAAAQPDSDRYAECDVLENERYRAVCTYMTAFAELTISSVDYIAVGTTEEMFALKPMARRCGLINQVDPLNARLAVLRVVNASPEAKACATKWIQENRPALRYTPERLDALIHADASY